MTMAQLRETVISRDRSAWPQGSTSSRTSAATATATGTHRRTTGGSRLEHVKKDGRRIDSADHCIALCYRANVEEHWSSPPENNRLANAYLFGIAVGGRAVSRVTVPHGDDLRPHRAPYVAECALLHRSIEARRAAPFSVAAARNMTGSWSRRCHRGSTSGNSAAQPTHGLTLGVGHPEGRNPVKRIQRQRTTGLADAGSALRRATVEVGQSHRASSWSRCNRSSSATCGDWPHVTATSRATCPTIEPIRDGRSRSRTKIAVACLRERWHEGGTTTPDRVTHPWIARRHQAIAAGAADATCRAAALT